ncbi:FAD-dependent monooxygenase [Rhizosphaericola mali]|nr:FAD-dependent monooxygenase [Rhizosphaericola mali]
MEKICIIGGGIAGLTMALVLKKLGISFQLFEKSEAPNTRGAGILLANNAMQIYKNLGIGKEILLKGNIISKIHLTDNKFHPNSIQDLAYFEKKYNSYNISIHRSDLQNILVNNIGEDNISYGKELDTIDINNKTIIFKDGSIINYDYIIASDGIYSKIRQNLFPTAAIISAGQIAWRGISTISLPEKYAHISLEAWAPGARFGMNRLNENQSYWFLVADNDGSVFNIEYKNTLVKKFPLLAQELVFSTPTQNVYMDEIKELELLEQWGNNSIVLIGDAAHSMTPNLGQGACQAIEDAFILGELIQKYSINYGINKLFHYRNKKVKFIKNNSRKLGKISHWKNAQCINIRNYIMRALPDSFNRILVEKLFRLAKIDK